MKRIGMICSLLLAVVSVWGQTFTDTKCLSLMDVPLEGPDTVFVPAFESVGFTRVTPEDPEPGTYYFAGSFYGIKSNLTVTVDEDTHLLSEVLVTCGPYHTRAMYDKNQKYLIQKLQREWGNFKAKGDGSLYLLNDYGYIQQSQMLHENGSNSIRYYYLNSKLEGHDLIDRVYNQAGYLIRAAMLEKTGEKSMLTYEYDHENNLKRRTLVNMASGIKSVNEYKYNGDNEISQQSQKVFNKENECVLSITMKNNYEEHDDNGNWTKNTLSLTYWEKDQRAQMATVHQTRTISYWDED